jgi:hypothetical protein
MVALNGWVAVASAEHVWRGQREGFMQVCHGKCVPLRRVRPGDRVAYYSPTVHFGARDRLQAFTALGTVKAGEPYQIDMGGGFHPYRRDVAWDALIGAAPIAPLLDRLSFTAGRASWGQALRFGLFRATLEDLDLIADAMRRPTPAPLIRPSRELPIPSMPHPQGAAHAGQQGK